MVPCAGIPQAPRRRRRAGARGLRARCWKRVTRPMGSTAAWPVEAGRRKTGCRFATLREAARGERQVARHTSKPMWILDRFRPRWILLAILSGLSLSACGDSRGDRSPDGPAPDPGAQRNDVAPSVAEAVKPRSEDPRIAELLRRDPDAPALRYLSRTLLFTGLSAPVVASVLDGACGARRVPGHCDAARPRALFRAPVLARRRVPLAPILRGQAA